MDELYPTDDKTLYIYEFFCLLNFKFLSLKPYCLLKFSFWLLNLVSCFSSFTPMNFAQLTTSYHHNSISVTQNLIHYAASLSLYL